MDIQVKERLTGALILVAVLVLLVPEILPGPVDERGSAGAAGEAAEGPPLRSYSMELGTGDGSTQQALAPQATAAAPEAPAQTPAAEPATTEPVAEPAASAAVAPEPAPLAAPVAASPAVPDRREVPANGGWWVQVGSFSQSSNAQRLTGQLNESGFPAQLSSVRSAGKELFRVRAGPVADRAAAQALQARLAAAGHKGSLVAP